MYIVSECVGTKWESLREKILAYGNKRKPLLYNVVAGQTYKFMIAGTVYNTLPTNPENGKTQQLVFTISENASADPGQHCSNAIVIAPGQNAATTVEMPWMEYTASKSGKTTFSSKAHYNIIGVYTECGSDINLITDAIASGAFNKNNEFFLNVEKDQKYYLWFDLDHKDEITDESFTITEGGVSQPGETAETAIEVTVGNEAIAGSLETGGVQWCKYIATKSGKLVVSSCNKKHNLDTRVVIFDHNNIRIAQADDNCQDMQETLTFDVEAGLTYYIRWGGFDLEDDRAFFWTLMYDEATNVNTTDIKTNVHVYPNPVNDILFFSEIAHKGIISFYSLTGKMIRANDITNKNQINVSNLPKGIYIYKLEKDGQTFNGKLMKK